MLFRIIKILIVTSNLLLAAIVCLHIPFGHCHGRWQLQEVLAMGDESFPGSGGGVTEYDKVTMQQKYRVSTDIAPEFNAPSKASDRQPNGFDLYDMLGNLAEWSEHVYKYHDGVTSYDSGYVYGGSYLGISEIGNSNFINNNGIRGGNPMRLAEAQINGSLKKPLMPLVCCVVYLR